MFLAMLRVLCAFAVKRFQPPRRKARKEELEDILADFLLLAAAF
jgi:NTP pyrophosphatase (non-canonical NTP hydrolase)